MNNDWRTEVINKLKQRLKYIDPQLLEEFFEERAAIREYNGGLPRDEAEEAAFFDTIEQFALANHIMETSS